MNAYRIPGRDEIDNVAAEARRDARRLRLQERLQLIDALIGSPERAATGGASVSALFGGPFFLAGAIAFWLSDGNFQPFGTTSLIGFAFFAIGFVVTWTWQTMFHVARFVTRRSLAKLQ